VHVMSCLWMRKVLSSACLWPQGVGRHNPVELHHLRASKMSHMGWHSPWAYR
jgi:hypothetical protein